MNIRSARSLPIEAMRRLKGSMATPWTKLLWLRNTTGGGRLVELAVIAATSHSITVLSTLADAIRRPSALQARSSTSCTCPRRVASRCHRSLGCSSSGIIGDFSTTIPSVSCKRHNTISPRSAAVATHRPFGAKRAMLMVVACARRSHSHSTRDASSLIDVNLDSLG